MNGYENGPTRTVYVKEKKGKGATIISVVCALICLSMLLGTLVAGVYVQRTAKEVGAADISKYENSISALSAQVTSLSSQLSDMQRGSVAASTQAGTFSLVDTAALVSKSIVNVTVTVPSKTYQFGFYTYKAGGGAATGSGIIITDDGYIATNYHVVSYYDEYDDVTIDVTLSDGVQREATLVGGDAKNDLAVLKIDADGLTLSAAQIGQSDSLRVGQVVIAVGNPLGIEFAGTVTMGIVSALDRVVSEENTSETLIQTDAAINPGNSGGALFTADGKVVGITSSKIVDTDVEGIGFAIPTDYAMPIIRDLIDYGYVKDRPATGITGETLSASVARRYGLPQGVIVTGVDAGSGADLAGIKVNDIITQVNGTQVTTMADIQSFDDSLCVGDTISVTYYRNGQYTTVELLLMEDRGR